MGKERENSYQKYLFIFWWHLSKTLSWHHLYPVFTYFYSLLIEKDICDHQNILNMFLCVCVCLSSGDLCNRRMYTQTHSEKSSLVALMDLVTAMLSSQCVYMYVLLIDKGVMAKCLVYHAEHFQCIYNLSRDLSEFILYSNFLDFMSFYLVLSGYSCFSLENHFDHDWLIKACVRAKYLVYHAELFECVCSVSGNPFCVHFLFQFLKCYEFLFGRIRMQLL